MTLQKEQALLDAYEKFIQLNLGNVPLELAPGLVAENMMIYDTAKDERVFSLKDYLQIVSNQREQSKGHIVQIAATPVFHKTSAKEDVATIVTKLILKIMVEGNQHEICIRLTTVMEFQNEQWLAVHVHASKSDDRSTSGGTLHLKEWESKNEQLQQLVNEKTADLEHKNRQLEIEAALERVRAKMMAMHKSEELKEVIQLILDQLCGLQFNIDSASFVVDFRKSLDLRVWVAAPGQQYASLINLPYIDHPIFKRLVEAQEKEEHFYALTCTTEEKNRFFDHFFKYAPVTEERRKVMYSSTGWTQSSVLMKTVALNIYNYSGIPFSEEQNITVLRFGNVFEQTFTRFLDLQKAEEQAREAQIETALERVRSCSMAMQKSEELREVIQLVLDRLCDLNFNIHSASFAVELNESNDLRVWVAAPGQQYASRINFPYLNHLIFNRYVEAKEKGEEFYILTCTKEEKNRFFDHFFKYAPVPEDRRNIVYSSNGWAQSSMLMKTVALNIQNYDGVLYSEEQNNTLKRFGKVFEQTYTRFLDLQKAEAGAKEAVRQASLDRVRAEIASMRTTSDLERITPLIWKELSVLNVAFIRCGVFIMSEEQQQAHVYLSTPDGKAIAAFQLPFKNTELIEGVLSHWRNNRIFVDHWDAQKFAAWTKSLVEASLIKKG
ncbi:nuclear transport factor 2 family protein [Adhaeribacter radiodurans]|uniref:Nuclear transport factor 2 family protein n=1 Tax=Adhaeribacter radiodurans TaxID=2745197 RepID=A0A7L7L731_9BACT|nr:nuclear transport factor 2 family protein [Adhaeribacter radiodurans]QMU28335.1 nuclear transport factor 2 family protein [Adhaeribacter radiodurans]